jgi:hypothetical protein
MGQLVLGQMIGRSHLRPSSEGLSVSVADDKDAGYAFGSNPPYEFLFEAI